MKDKFENLKDNFINASNQNNRSTVELCITELSSGNFPKAIDLSEELIKKDINDSVGWATKALSQAHLFDYNNNLFFLKSSHTSLEEFRAKTSLSSKEIMTVESIFITTVLDRTIDLVTERVKEVIELRRKAMAEKAKASAAAIGAAMSAYAGSQSKSDVGKILGYGGAIAGTAASTHFNSNAELLNNASKGVFGVAVANISMTVGSAMTLKRNLNDLDFALREEATMVLKNWVNTLAFLYQQVIENLLVYAEELKKQNPFTKAYRKASINLVNAPEATQFVYLSKILGIENSIPQFKELEANMLKLKKIDENEIKSAVNKMHFIALSIIALMFILMVIGIEAGAIFLFPIGLFTYSLFIFKPLGKAGELKQSVKEFVDRMKNFKVSSDKIIVENMIPQDKSLD
ncbi:hypothetical protein [Mesohalobacter halotolerans]|uniref:Uncharacterized protein n=1 Tax=Mesohalobacter halotolerans TaxID=1883405 RepID=A0A4U5TR35_9FLAO|nr:hypothetical protein [Mesohalobacter halotolerans]TKS55834.1 hypothetical protein FCN74_07300 [Mesohalobacter halotolerans]